MMENSTQKKFIELDQRSNPLMSLKTLKFYSEKQSLPSEPQLNDTLYLQYKGFQKIIPQTISLYINLKTLHLNNNGLKKIQGLHMLRQLVNLYLNNNYIEKIQGLEELYYLNVLNLAHNKLDHAEGLEKLDNLKNLNLAENFFTKAKDLQGLLCLNKLNQLNLSHNQLQASEDVFQMISEIESLTILYLKSTPLSNLLKNYRKRFIYSLKKLKFLDNRPVLPLDHQLAQAWIQGGTEREKELKEKILVQKRQQKEKEIEQKSKLGQQKIKRQKQKMNEIKPIIYQRSQRPDNSQGLGSSYLPKQQIKLDALSQLQNSHSKIQIQKSAIQTSQQTVQNTYKKVQQVLGKGLSAEQQQEQQVKIQRSIAKKWNKKYRILLQQLLMKYKFDFSEVQPSLNMIISNISKKLMKPAIRFQITQLRYIWTEIQKEKRLEQQKQNNNGSGKNINSEKSIYQNKGSVEENIDQGAILSQ